MITQCVKSPQKQKKANKTTYVWYYTGILHRHSSIPPAMCMQNQCYEFPVQCLANPFFVFANRKCTLDSN